jgi:hypothetical protein
MAVTVVAVLALNALAGWALLSRYRNEADQARADLQDSARSVAAVAEAIVQSALRQLDGITASTELQSGEIDRISPVLGRLDTERSGFSYGISWVDTAGIARLLVIDEPRAVEIPLGDRDWFGHVMAGRQRVGSAVISRSGGRPILPLAVPVRDATGLITGAVVGSFALDRTDAVLRALDATNERSVIVDRSGQVIAAEGPLDELAPANAAWWTSGGPEPGLRSGVTDPLGRRDRTAATATVPTAGWTIVVSERSSDLLSGARENLLEGVVILVITSAALLATGALIGQRLQRRQDALEQQAEAAAATHERLDRLADTMAQLARSTTREQVADVVVNHGLPALGARAARLVVQDETGRGSTVALAARGWDAEVASAWERTAPHRDLRSPFQPAFGASTNGTGPHGPGSPISSWAELPVSNGDDPVTTLQVGFGSDEALDADRREDLATFAGRVSTALERVALHEAEHRLAVELQRAVVPERLTTIPGVVIDVAYLPADTRMGMGGDWYDTLRVDEDRLSIVIGDIIGHGVEAAAVVGRMRGAIGMLSSTESDPAALLEALDQLAASDPAIIASSALVVTIDRRQGTLTYSTAGHPPPLAVDADGSGTWLDRGRGGLLGLANGRRVSDSLQLRDGMSMLLYTDGLIERRGEIIDAGLDRLARTCAAQVGGSAAELAVAMRDAEPQRDDAVAMCVHFPSMGSGGHDDVPESAGPPKG